MHLLATYLWKYLKHTLATCAFSKTWQSGGVEHCTAGYGCAVMVEEDDSGRRHRGGADNNSWVGATSRGEATVTMRAWGNTSRRAGAAVVERKADKRRGGEEGMREARWSAVMVMREFFFILWRP
jgi:hypothetical protein